MNNYIDTHFHLDLMPNEKQLVAEIEKNKIYTIAVTNLPSVFFHTENICKSSKYIRPALGFHPQLAHQKIEELSLLPSLIHKTRYIGEIGLDFSREFIESQKSQIIVFEEFLKLSEGRNKVFTLHSRNSIETILDVIGGNYRGRFIFHWYSGTLTQLDRIIELGGYLSVNIKMTQSIKGREIIKRIPIDRLLVESDGPFVAGGSPLSIKGVYSKLCQLNKGDERFIRKKIFDNFKTLLEVSDL